MKKLITTLFFLMGIFTAQAQAATVTLFGDDVSFTFDDSTIFGSASIAGNSIAFVPSNFATTASNLDGIVTQSGTINITIEATTAGFDMTSFLLNETGSYSLAGGSTSVSANGHLQITSSTTTCSFVICNEISTFNTGSITDSTGSIWSSSTTVSLADNLNGWTADDTVTLQLYNLLTATSTQLGDEASIQKSFGTVGITVNPIPVPAALWLFGSGLIALAALFRRRSA